jgi:hemerythrin superfamily protein
MPADPFAMLEADHRSVEAMLKSLAESEPGSERDTLVDKLTTAFEAHASFEESAIYPLVPDVMGAEKEEEAEIEHRLAREGVQKLREMASQPGFGAAVEMLEGGIGHHVEEEESEMFPALRRATDDATKDELMAQLREAKAAAGLPLVDPEVVTKEELMSAAAAAGVDGRSSMSKEELAEAIGRAG